MGVGHFKRLNIRNPNFGFFREATFEKIEKIVFGCPFEMLFLLFDATFNSFF